MKYAFILSLSFLWLLGCKKADNTDPAPAPPTLSLTLNEATPGDVVEVKVSKGSLASMADISLGSVTVKGYAQGDSAYVFLAPVLAPGTVAVSLPSLPGSKAVNLTIKNYTPISNPGSVITDYIGKRNKAIDSLTQAQSVSGFQPSQETITFLNQLKEELDQQLSRLTPAEQEIMAYTMQKNMPNPAAYTMDLLPAEYYAKMSGTQGDVGDKLVATAKHYVVLHVSCVATVPAVVGTGAIFLLAPNPLTASAFLISFTAYVVSKEAAKRQAVEVGRLKGVAETIAGADALKMQSVDFYNNAVKNLSLSVDFRNLAATDLNLNTDISSAFAAEQLVVQKDQEIGSFYAKAVSIVSSLWTKLKATYPAYTAGIGKVPAAKRAQAIEGGQIIVKSISDPRISFSTALSGNTRTVKITSTATTEIPFTLRLAYVRSLDNKELTRDLACTFKPTPDSTELYKASVLGKYRVNNYKGNGPNSELYCEVKAGGQCVYSIYNDPSWADGYKFYASWSISKTNGRYYYSESGFWHYGFPAIEAAYPLTYPVSGFAYHNDTFYSK